MQRLLLHGILIIATLFISQRRQYQNNEIPVNSLRNLSNISGEYEGLKIAYDPQSKTVSGYFDESEIGNGTEKAPQFTCEFYLEGKLIGNKADIISYFPMDVYMPHNQDFIKGILETLVIGKIALRLEDDHEGCLNTGVTMSKSAYIIDKEKSENWIAINYITVIRSFFYTMKNESTIQKGYLVKGDIVCVDKKDKDWLHCTYYGKHDNGNQKKAGWIKANTVNAMH